MYADFDTYVKRYGDDLSPFCDESTATRYLRAASREIDRFTFDRFGGTLPESTIDAEKLQDCACELAECLYRIDQARDSAAETADVGGVKTAGPVASVSSGSESITYKAADSCYTTAAKTTAARDELVFDLLRRWLSGVAVDGTLVLYAGGDVLMLLHSDTITLFSRVRGARGQADTWVRHVLAGVKVEAKTAMTPGTTGDVPGHYVLLLVPKAAIGALAYAAPEVYQAADDRSGMIAFQPGDYFCRGEHDWAEYDVLCKVTECHRITSCAWFPLIAHFEVTAS